MQARIPTAVYNLRLEEGADARRKQVDRISHAAEADMTPSSGLPAIRPMTDVPALAAPMRITTCGL